MQKVPPMLELPSVDGMLDFQKQEKWNSHTGRALQEGSALLATRVNGLFPKDGSEAMTGPLNMGGFGISNVGTLSANIAAITTTLTVGANLTPIGANGSLVDSVHVTYSTNANLTTIIPVDDTAPLITEGDQVLTVSITPKATTNILRCRFSGFGACSTTTAIVAAMFQGSTCIDAEYFNPVVANGGCVLFLETQYVPGSLTSQTISVRIGPQTAATVRLNGTSAGRIFAGLANATLVVEEIKA